MLALAVWANPDQAAADVLAFESKLAGAQWSPADGRDWTATYNPATLAELNRIAPGFDWDAWAKAADLPSSALLIASENTAFTKMAVIYAGTDMATLRAWAAFHTVDGAAPYLSRPFVDTRSAFRGTVLRGTTANRPRADRGVQLVDQQLGDALGQQYVQGHLSPAEKGAAIAVVSNVTAAMRARLERNGWMSSATRQEAITKIDHMHAKIGYPDRWRSYVDLRIDADDLWGNVQRGKRFDWSWQLGQLSRPVDPNAWDITPQTVNAFYNSSRNEIIFPASILHASNPAADQALTYGTLGGFVGHEITHGFDDQGRKMDATGQLRDWWTSRCCAFRAARGCSGSTI
jgi:putative endopeptidase